MQLTPIFIMLLRLTTHAAAAYQPGLVRALRSVPRKLPPRASVGMTNGLDIFGRQPRKAPPTGVDGGDAADEETDRSEPVVKVYTVHSAVSPHLPWTSKAQEESTGSGFTIEHKGERYILTNAHVVADAAYVEVRKAGDANKYVATRRKVSHESDLATLTVEDDNFWRETTPLEFGQVPCLQDEVSVVGYPEGGEGVSVTVGVVSRIEIQRYAHSGANLLAIQIDAAINPGNSGGPVLDEAGRVIGVAFQNQQDSQNIGYVIPVPTIRHFLADSSLQEESDIERCQGFCSLGIFWQALENEQLRRYYNLDDSIHSGVLIRGLSPLAAASGILKRDDVILALGGQRIANDGSFAVGAQERLSFQHIIHLKFPGETVKMEILRNNETLSLSVPVQPLRRLVPATVYDEPQPYFVYGGFAFVGLTEPYLHEWGDDWLADAPQDLVHLALTGVQNRPNEQPVILSKCFPSRRTAGYSHMADRQVVSVNGHPVLNLQQMYSLVMELHESSEFMTFEVFCTGGNAVVTTGTSAAESTLEDTLSLYRIPKAASVELEDAYAKGSYRVDGIAENMGSSWSGDEYGAASAAGAPAAGGGGGGGMGGGGTSGSAGGASVVVAGGPQDRRRLPPLPDGINYA